MARWLLLLLVTLVTSCGTFGTTASSSGDASSENQGTDAADIDASNGDASVAPGTPFCETIQGASFCSDFERDQAMPFGWTDALYSVNGVGTIERARGAGKDGSTGLRVAVNATAGSRGVALRKELPQSPSTMREHVLEVDFRIESVSLDFARLAILGFYQAAGGYPTFGIAQIAKGASLDESRQPGGQSLSTNVVGSWHHARIVVTLLSTGTYRQSVFIDGQDMDVKNAQMVPTGGDIRVGIFDTSVEANAAVVIYDNVVLRTTPL